MLQVMLPVKETRWQEVQCFLPLADLQPTMPYKSVYQGNNKAASLVCLWRIISKLRLVSHLALCYTAVVSQLLLYLKECMEP